MLRRHVVVGVLAAAAILSAGCAAGESTTPVGLTSVAPTPTTTAAPAPDSTDSTPVGPLGGGQLPAGFPVPPGMTAPPSVSNLGDFVGAKLEVGSAKAAYDFYRSALPAAGYTITGQYSSSDRDFFFGDIRFSGNGYDGWLLFNDGTSSGGGVVGITLSRP